MKPLKNFGIAVDFKRLKMTYYDYEIARVGNIPADLKLQNEQGQTRWMTVTPEQIQQILEILNKEEGTA